MRSVWNGVLHFGRIPVPIALVPGRRDGGPSFRTLHRDCRIPVEQTTVCPLHGDVPSEELVKGWEIAPGQFVLVEDEELAALVPEAGRDLEVIAYVDRAAIDSVYLTRSYYLRPAKELAGKQAYALVAAALDETGAAIITRHVARGAEHLSAIVALDNQLLGLHALALAEDVIDPQPIRDTIAAVNVDDDAGKLARQLIERYAIAFDPNVLVGTQRARVRALLEGKIVADEIVRPDVADVKQTKQPAVAADLESALRASLRDAPKPRRSRKRATVRA